MSCSYLDMKFVSYHLSDSIYTLVHEGSRVIISSPSVRSENRDEIKRDSWKVLAMSIKFHPQKRRKSIKGQMISLKGCVECI